MPRRLPTRSYLEATLVLAGAVACQCANALEDALESFGALRKICDYFGAIRC